MRFCTRALGTYFHSQVPQQQFIAASKRSPLSTTFSFKTALPFPTGCRRRTTTPLQSNCTSRATLLLLSATGVLD
jgi:hypothetical protein